MEQKDDSYDLAEAGYKHETQQLCCSPKEVDFHSTGKTIRIITPSNTHKIASMLSTYSTVFIDLTGYQPQII